MSASEISEGCRCFSARSERPGAEPELTDSALGSAGHVMKKVCYGLVSTSSGAT